MHLNLNGSGGTIENTSSPSESARSLSPLKIDAPKAVAEPTPLIGLAAAIAPSSVSDRAVLIAGTPLNPNDFQKALLEIIIMRIL